VICGAAPAACAAGDLRAPAAVGGEHAMEAGEVDPRPGNERGEPRDEIQRLEDHVCGAVTIGGS